MTLRSWLEAGVLVWVAISVAQIQVTLKKFLKGEWTSLGNGFLLTVIFWPFAVWNSARD